MNPFIALAAAMAISMVVIPLVSRIAPRLGMIDRPNARKVHTAPVPLGGGLGIAVGVLVPDGTGSWILKPRVATDVVRQ